MFWQKMTTNRELPLAGPTGRRQGDSPFDALGFVPLLPARISGILGAFNGLVPGDGIAEDEAEKIQKAFKKSGMSKPGVGKKCTALGRQRIELA
jgi:hypothetical protein